MSNLFKLLLAVLSPALLAGNLRLDLYINTNQCFNCNIALNTLNYLHEDIIKNVYFPEANMAASEELMENYSSVKNLHLKYFNEENSPFKNFSHKSFYLLYNNGSLSDSLELNSLFANYHKINILVKPPFKSFVLKKKIALPDSIKLSDRLAIFVKNKQVCVSDYILNKSVVITLSNDNSAITKVLQIKGSSFKAQAFLKSGIVDTAVYRIVYKDLKFLGKTKPQVDMSYLTDSSLCLLLSFPCGIVRPVEKDTGIGGTLFLYQKNLYTHKSKLYSIPEDRIPGFITEEYYIANMSGFYINKNKVCFTLFQEHMKKQNRFLAEYEFTHDKLKFKSLLPHQVSDSTYFNTDFGNTQVFLTSSNSRFLFAQYQPVIVNTTNNAFYYLESGLKLKDKHSLHLIDVWQSGENNLYLLIEKDKKLKCIEFDIVKNAVISETWLPNNPELNPESARFSDKETITVFDKSNKNILLFDLK